SRRELVGRRQLDRRLDLGRELEGAVEIDLFEPEPVSSRSQAGGDEGVGLRLARRAVAGDEAEHLPLGRGVRPEGGRQDGALLAALTRSAPPLAARLNDRDV